MTFVWTPPDPLNNTAKTRSIYMTELQVAANVRRVEIAQSQLSFINQNIGKKFILSAIEELKTVVNQLAIDFGYPTGVQDPALLGRPYVTITKKYGKYVCHYPIINDLRQVLNLLVGQAGLVFAYLLDELGYPRQEYVYTFNITEGPLTIKDRFRMELANTPGGTGFTIDRINIFRSYPVYGFNTRIYKDNITNGSNISNSEIFGFSYGYDITVDADYCWIVGRTTVPDIEAFAKINKNDLSSYTITNLTGMTNGRHFYRIVNDKDYLYVFGWKYVSANPPVVYDYIKRLIIRKYSKVSLTSYIEYELDANLIPEDLNNDPNQIEGWDMGIDTNYLYITYTEIRVTGILQPGDVTAASSCILRVDKSSMSISEKFDIFTISPVTIGSYIRHIDSGIAVSNDNIYVVMRKENSGPHNKYAVYTKEGILQFTSNFINSAGVSIDGPIFMACRHEYEVTLS